MREAIGEGLSQASGFSFSFLIDDLKDYQFCIVTVSTARIRVLGITFKEHCPDIGSSKLVDRGVISTG